MVALVAFEPEPSNLMVSGAGPAAAEDDMTAAGGVGGTTTGGLEAVMAMVVVLVAPELLATVNLAVYVPAVV